MKDEVRTDNDWYAWNHWRTVQARLWRLRQPGPPLEFPSEHGILTGIYAQVREEEQLISLQFLGGQQDVSTCRKKKRKQVDDTAAYPISRQLCIGLGVYAEDEVRAGDVYIAVRA